MPAHIAEACEWLQAQVSAGQARVGHNGMATLPSWPTLERVVPAIVATMRRYQQIACGLRPGSVRTQ